VFELDNSEIKINSYELKDSNGNIITLAHNWETVPFLDDGIINKSKGNVPESIKECINCYNQVADSFNILLNNSICFFDKIGIRFTDADEEAATTIKGG
jgi:hypothetical protein